MKNKKFLITILVLLLLVGFILLLPKKDDKKWRLKEGKVTKGDITYNIGEEYDYDETNGGQIKDLTDITWKVLGVNDEGNLLIMASSNVEEIYFGDEDILEVSQNDYINGVFKLNEISKKYGQGKGAIDSRSITMSDINNITKFNPNEFGLDSVHEYNNEVTYYWTNEVNPEYESTNGSTGVLTSNHNNKFVWYDVNKKEWNLSEKNIEETDEIATLKNTWYAYENTDYTTNTSKVENDSLEYKMLFLDNDGNKASYWVASPFIYTANMFTGYGYHAIKGDSVNYNYFLYSVGKSRKTFTHGVRPVVVID